MNLYEETKFLMKKYGITANKGLGQNFLVEEAVLEDIVDAAEVGKEDLVIEIGPGLGTLTKYLLEKAGKVIAIELDERMLTVLKDRFWMYSSFSVISEDVLKVNLEEIIEKENFSKVKIVANLPYYITTPIIMQLLEKRLKIDSITVMIQKEVADRLKATPGGEYSGAITYTVAYYAETEGIRIVGKECFIPQPEVESEVIRFKIRKEPLVQVKNEEKFFKLIKVAFLQRRKTLLNTVSNNGLVEKERMLEILKELNIDERIRGEKLSIQQFAEISDRL